MDPITAGLALAKFAPSVLRFFGVGEKSAKVAEQVVGIAQTVTGTKAPEAALGVLQKSPEMALKFELAVLDKETELEQAYLADRAGARTRDVEIRKLTGGSNTRADIMVGLAALGLIACLVALVAFQQELPGEAVGIISTIAGIFGACLKDAFQFEFGSSRGSKSKDDILGQLKRG